MMAHSSAAQAKKVIPVEPEAVYEARKKFQVRSVSGRFANWRWILVWLTQAAYYGLCWFEWNGRQALLFDIVNRKFYLFGLVLWPQDVIFLTLLLIASAFALFLFTAVAGRLFCGYACPQTVYTEIFMWIEEKIEGGRGARVKLDQAPWSAAKFARKAAKHAAWIAVALWTGFTFVGYFTPVRELWHEAIEVSLGPWETFWVLFYGFATWGNAGFMREQVCKYMCPYARFQSVMFDPDTLIVSYDAERGEPRGSRRAGTDHRAKGLGDCVNCGICVQVCPTGIDIREGLQYECIGCSACIDACDQVMEKVGYPPGLIRYSTENALQEHWGRKEILHHLVRPRILIYTALVAAVFSALVVALAIRVPLKVNVIRDRGTLAREVEGGLVENVFRLQVMNTAEEVRRFSIAVGGLPGIALASEGVVEVGPATARSVSARVRVPPDAGGRGSHPIRFVVKALGHEDVAVSEKASFLLP